MEYLTGVVEAEEENVAVDVVVASAFDAVVVVEVADDGIRVTLVVVTLVSVDESTLAARLGDSVNCDVGSGEGESRVTGVKSGRGPTSLKAEFLVA